MLVEVDVAAGLQPQPLLKHFASGWGVHRDLSDIILNLSSTDEDEYGGAIQLGLRSPKTVMRGFSEFQWAQMTGRGSDLKSKTVQQQSDMFVAPQLCTFMPNTSTHHCHNTSKPSERIHQALGLSTEDSEQLELEPEIDTVSCVVIQMHGCKT